MRMPVELAIILILNFWVPKANADQAIKPESEQSAWWKREILEARHRAEIKAFEKKGAPHD